jgi:DNA-binding sugar fermentation-stimulating protein
MALVYSLSKQLMRATILARPSSVNKSPYLADIQLDDTSEVAICHTAALGCCGYIAPGSKVWVAPKDLSNDTIKSKYEVYHVEQEGVIICCNPLVANKISAEMFHLNHIIEDGVSINSEVTCGDSRYDFGGQLLSGKEFFLEVKSVVMADPIDGTAAELKSALPTPGAKLAIFPYGKRKVSTDPLSPRALKHVEGLTEQVAKGKSCYLLFLIMRPDVRAFTVTKCDPTYQAAVKAAIKAGVHVLAYRIEWKGNKAYNLGQLPVEFAMV